MIGQVISHYRVLRRLGGGGMGEVYEAEDLRLGRHVALKFLTASHTDVRLALRRFEREARAASSLNHPHICTIHDFGEHDGQAFLVMELLDGETLRARLARERLDLARVIDLGIQIADALDAAHRAAIIHRDVTPSNIFITARGDAKILDFGLAKVMPYYGRAPALDTEAPTATAGDLVTSPGAAMGTVAYMSPEQARGEELDCRTDLFSFGVVLYEMATGQRPFAGRTSALVFDAILHGEPLPPLQVNPALPAEFGRIIGKALEKDLRLRYQNASDIKVDLERLKRGREPEKVTTQPAEKPLTATSAAPSPGEPRAAPKARRGLPARMVLLVAIAAAVIAVAVFLWRREPGPPAFTPRQITTAAGWQAEPAIAPDGDVIAYVSNERNVSNERSDGADIFLVDVRGISAPRQLTTARGPKHHLTWYPDGRRLAFAWDVSPGQASIYTVARSGGEPSLLVDEGEDPAISPDGTRIAFVRKDASGDLRVVVAPLADVSKGEVLTTGNGDGAWDHHEPAWSPDGNRICYRAHRGLWVIPAAGGRVKLITDETARDSNPFWSHDGRFIYFTSKREGAMALWRVPADGGRLSRLTPGTGPEQQASLTRDGRVLAFSTLLPNPDLVLLDLATRTPAVVPNEQEDMCPVFGPDRVYFVSNRSGKYDIWVLPLATPEPANAASRLTDQSGNVSHPTASPDGRWVAYYAADARNTRDIWIVGSSGGAPTRFTTHDADDMHPAWSPDGHEIAFASQRTGGLHIWVAAVSEGKPAGVPRQVTFGSSTDRDQAPAWSPDGSRIAYITQSSDRDWEVRITAADGHGTPVRGTATRGARRVRWDAASARLLVSGLFDEPAVSLRAFDPATLRQLPLDPSIVFGENDDLVDFDVSKDGSRLVFSRDERRRGNIWVYEARRPF